MKALFEAAFLFKNQYRGKHQEVYVLLKIAAPGNEVEFKNPLVPSNFNYNTVIDTYRAIMN